MNLHVGSPFFYIDCRLDYWMSDTLSPTKEMAIYSVVVEFN